MNETSEIPPPEATNERREHMFPTTPTRKRQNDSDSDSDNNEPEAKRARLTRKNLARFNRMGKKGSKAPAPVPPPESTAKSSTTKSTSTTSSGFAIQARNNGILDPRSSKPPTNLAEILDRHNQSRATASPPESRFKHYVNRVEGACNEATMVFEVGRHALKEYEDEGYKGAFNQAFTGFPKDVGFNNGLSAPQPDFVEGLEIEEFRPFPVDEHVSGAVLYKDDPRSITLPHITGEWKGRGKDMEEARLQSAFDGAALVHARSEALSYMGKSDPPGHAEITTFTTDGTTLNQYAHYAEQSEDGTTKYHQYRIKSTNLTNSHEDFKDGYKQLRNAQDHARNQSYALKDDLTDHWKQTQQHCNTLQDIAAGTHLPVLHDTQEQEMEASVPEDQYDNEPIEPQPVYQPTPPTDNPTPSIGRKRKTSSHRSSHESSHGSSRHKYKSYWSKDATSGLFYHKHSDGTVSWLDDDDDDGHS